MIEDAPEPPTDHGWRTRNLGALLFAATDRCMRHKLQVLGAHGYATITDAQLTLFLHLDPDGTRLTGLAARARLTKQSMIELVDKAVGAGLVERVADPEDGRAKMVRLTVQGRFAMTALEQSIAAVDEQVASAAGADLLNRMRTVLGGYAALPVEGGSAWRSTAIGRLFALAARRFADEALWSMHAHGYGQISEMLLTLFRVLDLEGTRLTELAARAHVTKQSMREAVDRAETLGLIARAADPHDGRAKIIGFTSAGLTMLEQARLSLAEAERTFAAGCGDAFLTEMKAGLTAFAADPLPAAA